MYRHNSHCAHNQYHQRHPHNGRVTVFEFIKFSQLGARIELAVMSSTVGLGMETKFKRSWLRGAGMHSVRTHPCCESLGPSVGALCALAQKQRLTSRAMMDTTNFLAYGSHLWALHQYLMKVSSFFLIVGQTACKTATLRLIHARRNPLVAAGP